MKETDQTTTASTIQQNTPDALRADIEALLSSRCTIPGSLPQWEAAFTKLCMAWGRIEDSINPVHIVYSADNGITEEPHIQYPQSITYHHTVNMLHGGATISAFCRFNTIPLLIADVGINHPEPVGLNLKAAAGTKNFTKEPAMTKADYTHVWNEAARLIANQKEAGYNLISFGEMGIGNTTTSAAVLSALTGLPPEETVGYGSGASEEMYRIKRDVVSRGLSLHHAAMTSPQDILRCVGGFDLVALTSSMLACMERQIPFVIDGFITAVALAAAYAINPKVADYALPSHQSRETGMTAALTFAHQPPESVMLHASMALGEGSGAVLMVQLLKTIYYAFTHIISLEDIFKETLHE